MKKSFQAFGCAVTLLLPFHDHRVSQAGEGNFQSTPPVTAIVQVERGRLEWHFRNQKMLTYLFGKNQFKPYVGELFTLGGENVLRDAPSDHPHHHGLMYAVGVNGLNFWEEVSGAGYECHVAMLNQGTGRNADGLPQASFTELIHWVPERGDGQGNTASTALLIEQRTLTLVIDEAKKEVTLAWHAEFEPGTRMNRVRLGGSDYNGLGLRLPAAWERAARHQNSENAPYLTGGKHDVVPARWSAVSHARDGRTTEVVLCARTGSHAGTSMFFTMTEPFTYLSATQGLDKVALEYRAGEHFSLDYLVLVYDGPRTTEQLEERYRAWTQELK